jgi:nitroreductase
MKKTAFIDYDALYYDAEESRDRSESFLNYMNKRRSIRHFSDRNVDRKIIENIIMTASSAPSGAHKQPWNFCAISDASLKSKIRVAAEKEEYLNYNGRMSEEWLADLDQFETDWHKDFITTAPWIIVLFKKSYDLDGNGQKQKNYYVNESVGIAAGFLITAIHNAGLVTLTHTPSPMNFLQDILDRPSNEKAFLLLPIGYPAEGTQVPALKRKTSSETIIWY